MLVDSTQVLTGAADNTIKLWDCERGTEICSWSTNSAVRSCGFSHLGDLLMFTTDIRNNVDCELFVYDARDTREHVAKIPIEGEKVTAGVWGPFDEFIITGHADGSVRHYDYRV